jgi:NAD(P) transhydrogenase
MIGSGPAGQKGAVAAAKTRKRVAMIGGVCVHTGTIPSKTLGEAIFQITGFAVKALYGNGYRGRVDISAQDVSSRVNATPKWIFLYTLWNTPRTVEVEKPAKRRS